MNYQVRAAKDEELPFLWEMLYQAIYIPPGMPVPPKSIVGVPEISVYLDGWGRVGDTAVVAEDETNRLIGAAWYRTFSEEQKGYGFIKTEIPELSIAVRKEWRGFGVGYSILQELIRKAELSGLEALSLSVDPSNPAVQLYRKLGFQQASEAENLWMKTLK